METIDSKNLHLCIKLYVQYNAVRHQAEIVAVKKSSEIYKYL